MSDTKEDILLAALRRFSREGFEATPVSAIASDLGMTKGALYKHYKNKRDIFDSILARMEQRDAETASAFGLPEGTLDEMGDKYRSAAVEAIIGFSRRQFRYWTEDEFASCFRRMLTLEQHRSAEMTALYQQYLGSGPLDYTADLLGSLGYAEPLTLAAKLYAPMFLLYAVYDGSSNKHDVTALADACLDESERRLLRDRPQ